jgi:hypothetical protein
MYRVDLNGQMYHLAVLSGSPESPNWQIKPGIGEIIGELIGEIREGRVPNLGSL